MIKKGLVFALHHRDSNKTIQEISLLTNIHTSRISNFEMGKCALDDEIITNLYRALGLTYKNDVNEMLSFTEIFYKFYESILTYKNYKHYYKEILIRKLDVLTTIVYPQYLLAQFLYATYEHDSLYDYEKVMNQLDKCFSCLEEKQKQIYYDTKGVHYQSEEFHDVQKALYYFREAEAYGFRDITAMVRYHKAISLILINNHTEALEMAQQAQQYFAQNMVLERMLLCSGIIANIYRRNGAYRKAVCLYQQCVKQMNTPEMMTSRVMVYHNLSWTFVLMEEYESAIEYANETITLCAHFIRPYYCLAYAYANLNRMEEAKKSIKKARELVKMQQPSSCIKAIVDAIYTCLSVNKKEDLKIRKLTTVLKEAEKAQDLEIRIFILRNMLSILKAGSNIAKIMECQDELIQCYTSRK